MDAPSLPTPPSLVRIPGPPTGVDACRFDLDGVLTRAAQLHAAAWKQTMPAFLRQWAAGGGVVVADLAELLQP